MKEPPPQPVPPVKDVEKKKYEGPSATAMVQNLMYDKSSSAGSYETNQGIVKGLRKDYDTAPITQFTMGVKKDEEKFKILNDEFKSHVDHAGNSMFDVAQRFLHDPEFAEKQRQEIAELRKKKGRR